MPDLLTTKLFAPRSRPGAVLRRSLIELLKSADGCALVLVSAPAGFGKTSLIAQWTDAEDRRTAWLSLDSGDDDATRFWQYIVAALQEVDPRIASSAAELLASPQPPPVETVAGLVVNDLAAASDRVRIVLDDYHHVEDEALHASVLFLVEHLPTAAQVVVITRADPPWPLARLRAQGAVAEIRAADLRFSDDEASMLLRAAGLGLSDEDIRVLEARTEGWVAGLKLAALSLRNHSDTATFIQNFAGSHRFVLDYLAQEVLDQQSDETRRFLIRTSVLDRLSGELCGALAECADGQQRLEALESQNLFIEPLDDNRTWFRYHQLFADVLRARLAEDAPGSEHELHRRAAQWFEEHGFLSEAVGHALQAGDPDWSASLVAMSASATFLVGSQSLFLRWCSELPTHAIESHPELALGKAWARFVIADFEGMFPALETAAAAIERFGTGEAHAALRAQLDGIRAWVSYQTGDLETAAVLAASALQHLPEQSLVPSQVVACARGYSLLLLGRLDEARDVARKTAIASREARDAVDECLAIALEGQADLIEGRLVDAARRYERAIEAGTVNGEPLPPVGIAQVQLAEILRERNELEAARDLLDTAIAACERSMGLPEWVFEGRVTLARCQLALGDPTGARDQAKRADRLLREELEPGGMEPIVGRALGYRLRYWLAAGEVAQAAEWLERRGVSTEGRTKRDEPLVVELALTLLAQGRATDALDLAERMLEASQPQPGTVVEAAVIKGKALEELGRAEDAAAQIARALALAAPDGYARLFVDQGSVMADLIERARPAGRAVGDRADAILAAIRADAPREAAAQSAPTLPESLNERELALLKLFAEGRTNGDIADELYLSINTVKWHARNLYGKLGVSGRAQAVARGTELGIL